MAKNLKAWFVSDDVQVICHYSVSVHRAVVPAGVRWYSRLQNFTQVVETGSVKFTLIFAKHSPKTLRVLRSERDMNSHNKQSALHRMFGLYFSFSLT